MGIASEIRNASLTDAKFIERRRYPRRRLRQRATIKLASGEILQGDTIEMSLSGLSVMLPKPMAMDSRCFVSFEMFVEHRKIRVSGAGQVKNCSLSGLEGFRVGMLFVFADPEVKEIVAELLK